MAITKQHKNTIVLLSGLGAIITGVVALITYINTREHRKLQKANLEIDKEIKMLELEKRKTEFNKTNLL